MDLKEPNTFKAATIIFVGVFCMSFILSYAFVLAGFIQNAFLMTLIISTISLGCRGSYLKRGKVDADEYRSNHFACSCHC